MNISELKSKKLADLRDIARSLGLTGYSGLRKQDLIYLILETEAEVESTRREAPVPAGTSSKAENTSRPAVDSVSSSKEKKTWRT